MSAPVNFHGMIEIMVVFWGFFVFLFGATKACLLRVVQRFRNRRGAVFFVLLSGSQSRTTSWVSSSHLTKKDSKEAVNKERAREEGGFFYCAGQKFVVVRHGQTTGKTTTRVVPGPVGDLTKTLTGYSCLGSRNA